ncbi:carbonic anhydrase [Castellaniella sp. MT123]|uniref:carbonic anhydrase n=1 Tax=Castellaniella sp. MT123 TaxID=3140381 RepID=UPI0031F3F80A
MKAVTEQTQYPGHIQSLVTTLVPVVKKAGNPSSGLLEAATEQNVRQGMADLTGKSTIIDKAHQAGALRIVGGIYRLGTGKVDFLA